MSIPPQSTTPRPWFRYSLRSLFLLITVMAVYLGWAMHWIRQRHELINRPAIAQVAYGTVEKPAVAHWSLRPLGERGVYHIQIFTWDHSEELVDRLFALFPEATTDVYIDGYYRTIGRDVWQVLRSSGTNSSNLNSKR